MVFEARVALVLIASPGDTGDERDAVERALRSWNSDRSERESFVLLPLRWELDAVPRLGQRGQALINEQLVDRADVVVAIFDARLGSQTPEAVSGTAEEITRANKAGKPVHVWFSEEDLPRTTDPAQLQALNDFRRELETIGLLGTYSSPDDLLFKVRSAIESDLPLLLEEPARARSSSVTGAVLRARYEEDREQETDSRGKLRTRVRRQRIVVENLGSARAESASLELIAAGEGSAPTLLDDELTADILPQGSFMWPIASHLGTARVFDVVMTWTERGQEQSERQTISH